MKSICKEPLQKVIIAPLIRFAAFNSLLTLLKHANLICELHLSQLVFNCKMFVCRNNILNHS